jgi:hypothetical protein
MVPAATEAEGIDNFATAFENYFAGSTVSGVTAAQSQLGPATDALKLAMSGLANVDGAAAMAAGVSAFWSTLSGLAAVVWVVVPVLASTTPPPGLAGLQAALAVTGAANIAGGLSLVDAADAMATTIHASNTGGFAVNTAPTPVSIPIL